MLTAGVLCIALFSFMSTISAQDNFHYNYDRQDDTACVTPNGENAHCISIYSCRVLYDALASRNSQMLNFIRESQCGYDEEPLVCCGTVSNYRPNRVTPPPPRRPTTRRPNRRPSVSSNSRLPGRDTCGFQSPQKILQGEVTGIDEFPWMALLQYRKRSGGLTFSCGGTLISKRYVLTAAHCVKGQILTKVGPLVKVRLGEWNTETGQDCVTQEGVQDCNEEPVDAGVEKTIPHSGYSDQDINRYNDIALVRLDRDIEFTIFIAPICLPTSSDKADAGDKLFVAGWGRTENANNSPLKLKLRVPVASTQQCARTFRQAGVSLGDSQLCAGGERGKDSCNGDSGGPLMNVFSNDSSQWYIEGVVSFGARCGTEDWPGIYTRVSSFLDWIDQNIE